MKPFKEFCAEALNEGNIKGIPSDLKKLGGKNLTELAKEVKSEIKLDLTKCEFKKVNAKIVKRVEKASDVLDGTLYFITCLDTGGSNNNVAFAYFSRKETDTFSAGPDVEYTPDDFWNLLEEDDTYTYQVIPQSKGLNESLSKGIPADAIQSAYDMQELIKSFAKNTKDNLGVSIDLKKCNFADVSKRDFERAKKNKDKVSAPRMFFAWGNDEEEGGVAYLILTKRSYITDFTFSPDSTYARRYEMVDLDFDDFASENLKEIIPVGVTEYPLIKKLERHL